MNTYVKLAGYNANETEWIDTYLNKMKDRLKKAIDKGVPIVAGSDNYTDIKVSRGESSTDMLRYYFEAGMKPLDILQSSTYISAFHLNKENDIGYINPQANADIIAVKGDIINDFISNPKVHIGFEITGYPTKLMLAGLKWNFLSEHTAKNNNLNATLNSHFVYADIGIGLNRHSFSIAPLSIGMGGLFNKLEFKRGINPNSFNELINEFSINEEINQNLFIINLGSRLDFHFWPNDDYFFNVGVKVNYLVSPFNSEWTYGENKKLTSKPAIFTNNPTIEISIGAGGMSD